MKDANLYTALIGALFGGAGLKVVEWVLTRADRSFEEATVIRRELRAEVVELRKEVSRLEAELDEWKQRYYELLKQYNVLEGRYRILEAKYSELERGFAEFRARYQGRSAKSGEGTEETDGNAGGAGDDEHGQGNGQRR